MTQHDDTDTITAMISLHCSRVRGGILDCDEPRAVDGARSLVAIHTRITRPRITLPPALPVRAGADAR